MKTPQIKELEKLPNTLPWVVGLTALVLVIAYVVTFHELPSNESPSAWGTFGDFLGGLLNPLISTCTLIVAVAVWRQQKIELSETKAALEDQAKTAQANRREQRFFDLMQIYQQTLDSFQEMSGGHAKHGKSALDLWLKSKNSLQGPSPLEGHLNPTKERRQAHIENWKDSSATIWVRDDHSGKFDHYFRVVFRILQDADDLLEEDKYLFMRLFRAQLSRAELTILGWNLWQGVEGKKMHGIACAYGLLKHLPKNALRSMLEKDLPSEIFGRKYAAAQKLAATQT